MSYIDMLYAQAFPDYKRKPANAAFDQVLTSGQKAPAGTNFVGDLSPEDMEILNNPITPEQYKALPGPKISTPQPQTAISAEVPMPIEYPAGYKVQVPQSEIIRQNVNEALREQMQERDALASNVKDAYSEREGYKKGMMDVIERMRALSDDTYQAPEIDAQIKTLSEKSNIPALPERSALADVISLFGAPVLGAMTGEAGALAQVPAGRAARDIYEGAHKQEVERVKLLKENTEKKIKALIDMKKSGQDSFDKAQARQLEKVKAELGATKELTSMSADDLKNQEEKLFRLNDAITKEVGGKSVDIAKMERSALLENEKNRRASILAGIQRERLDKPTEGERKGAFQYGLMEQAEKNIQDLKAKYGDYPSMKNKWFRTQKNIAGGMFGTTLMSDFLNSKAISPDVREQIQYELSFLESIGRIQSGAAINVGEWSQMREQYFPTYGDAPQSVASKEQQRQKALEGVSIIAGKAKSMVSPPKSVVNQFPKRVYKGNQSAIVSNEKELKEARSEGWK